MAEPAPDFSCTADRAADQAPSETPGRAPHPPVRRARRRLAALVLGLLLGGACALGVGQLAERRAALTLRRTLAAAGLHAEFAALRLTAGGGVHVVGLRLRRAPTGGGPALQCELEQLVARPASPAALLAGAAGRWRVQVGRWQGRALLPTGPSLTLSGERAQLELEAGRLRLQAAGALRLGDGPPLALRLEGQRTAAGALRGQLRFAAPLALSQLVAGGPARGVTVRGARWTGDDGQLTLDGVGLDLRGGLLRGALTRVVLTLAGGQLRAGRLVGGALTLDLAAFDRPAAAAAAGESVPGAGLAGSLSAPAAPAGAPSWVGWLATPWPGPLRELARLEVAELSLRVRAPRGELHLTNLSGALVPGRSLTVQAQGTGPAASAGQLALALAWPRWLDGGLHGAGRLTLADGRLHHPPLAADPVTDLDAELDAPFAWRPAAGTLALAGGRWTLRGLSGTVDLRLERLGQGPLAGALTLGWPAQPCQRLAAALPPGLAPLLVGMQLRGQTAGALRLAVDLAREREPVRELTLRGPALSGCRVSGLGQVAVERLATPFVQPVLGEVPAGARPGVTLIGPGTPGYVPLQEVPAHVRRAMLLTENASFYGGGPLSLGLLRKALDLNLVGGRYVYGGSTISQQLVKNLFLGPQKHLGRKLQEAFIAWRMEQLLSKDRILELYVNCIEFGPGIYGIEAAAQYYFGHPARELTPVEGVFLATIKPLPSDGPRMARNGRIDGWWIKRVAEVMQTLADEGEISAEELQRAAPFQPRFRLARQAAAE